MRLSSIVSEAWRNIVSGTTLMVSFTVLLAVLATLFGGYDAMTVIGLEHDGAERIRAAADVSVLAGAAVDGEQCDRLSTGPVRRISGSTAQTGHAGFLTSGALRQGLQITPLSSPGKDIASYEVTTGLLRLIRGHGYAAAVARYGQVADSVDASGVWVSTQLAEDFGLRIGSHFETNRGTVTVSGVFAWPNDGRDTRLSYALVVPVSAAGTFDECWAEQWPVSGKTTDLMYSTAIVGNESEDSLAGIVQLNKSFDSRYDATAAYRERNSRIAAVVSCVAGMLLGVVSVRRRRLEFAGALHAGERRGPQLLGIMLETVAWAALGGALSAGILLVYCARWGLSDTAALWLAAIRSPGSAVFGAVSAALIAGATIRESQLFRYFKDR